MTDDQLADKAKLLAAFYIECNGCDFSPMREVVEHAIGYAFRIGYRSREGEEQRSTGEG